MSNLHILVVEDNFMNRMLVRDLLRYRGHTVDEAQDVEQGWQRLCAQRPDIALLDIDLPGGGGVSLLHKIRADPRLKDLPCMAVTALAMQGDREKLLREGFDAYVSKPIDTRGFPAAVERLAAAKRSAGAA